MKNYFKDWSQSTNQGVGAFPDKSWVEHLTWHLPADSTTLCRNEPHGGVEAKSGSLYISNTAYCYRKR